MMTNARQIMINRYTRTNKDEKGKEAYRLCRKKERNDEEKIGGNTITKYCERIQEILYLYQESK